MDFNFKPFKVDKKVTDSPNKGWTANNCWRGVPPEPAPVPSSPATTECMSSDEDQSTSDDHVDVDGLLLEWEACKLKLASSQEKKKSEAEVLKDELEQVRKELELAGSQEMKGEERKQGPEPDSGSNLKEFMKKGDDKVKEENKRLWHEVLELKKDLQFEKEERRLEVSSLRKELESRKSKYNYNRHNPDNSSDLLRTAQEKLAKLVKERRDVEAALRMEYSQQNRDMDRFRRELEKAKKEVESGNEELRKKEAEPEARTERIRELEMKIKEQQETAEARAAISKTMIQGLTRTMKTKEEEWGGIEAANETETAALRNQVKELEKARKDKYKDPTDPSDVTEAGGQHESPNMDQTDPSDVTEAAAHRPQESPNRDPTDPSDVTEAEAGRPQESPNRDPTDPSDVTEAGRPQEFPNRDSDAQWTEDPDIQSMGFFFHQ